MSEIPKWLQAVIDHGKEKRQAKQHDFDTENPVYAHTGLYKKVDGDFKEIMDKGFQCKKCGMFYSGDSVPDDIQLLPPDKRYCESNEANHGN